MSGRGLYGDVQLARAVLGALGAPAAPSEPMAAPQRSTAGPGRGYRGRCGNAAFAAVYTGRGKDRMLVKEGSDGCPNEIAEGDETAGTLAVSVAVRFFVRLGAWPAWFYRVVSSEEAPSEIPQRYYAMAARIVEGAPANPLRLCQACIDKQRTTSAPERSGLRFGPSANHGPMPGLCYHGQRLGVCGVCPPEAHNS